MYITKPQKLTLTILATLAVAFSFASTVEAGGVTHEGVSRRDHANLKRMFKKRSPQGFPLSNFRDDAPPGPVAGAGSDPASLTESTSSSSTASASSSTVSSISSSASSSTSSTVLSSSASSSQSISLSISSSVTSSISVTESSTSTTTTTSSTEPPAQTSQSLNLQGGNTPTPPVNNPSTITRTQSETAVAQETESAPPKPSGAAQKKSNVLTILIAVASSIAGVAIIWTIFRKWKLARSSKFDERLQPIDWQPTNPDEGIIPAHRRVTSDTSFQSGSKHHGDNFAGRGANAGYGATSDSGHGSDYGHNTSIRDDHTGQHLAPVGGYADLARGPSPQPQMQQLNRGPSMHRQNYDVGVPLHHQTGYAEAYDYHGAPVRF